MASRKTQFEVDMMCDGCANAIKNVLKRVPGVEDVEVSWENNTAITTGTADVNAMLAAIAKTKKEHKLIKDNA